MQSLGALSEIEVSCALQIAGTLQEILWDKLNSRDLCINKHKLLLNTPPSVCQRNAKKRGRIGEEHIDRHYLEICHRKHQEWAKFEPSFIVCGDQKEAMKAILGLIPEFKLDKVFN